MELIEYLLILLLIAAAYFLLLRNRPGWRAVVTVLYSFGLLYYTLLSRIPAVKTGLQRWRVATSLPYVLERVLDLLVTDYSPASYGGSFFLNVLLFVPFGFLVFAWEKQLWVKMEGRKRSLMWKRTARAAAYGLLASLLIETIQKMTGLGVFDGLDLVANAAGAAAGALLFSLPFLCGNRRITPR